MRSSDLDIYRMAKVLIGRYGDGASLDDAARAEELLGKGDMDDRAGWLCVVDAVLTLFTRIPQIA